MPSYRFALLSLFALGSVLPGCTDSVSSDDVPSVMRVVSGDGQDGIVGEELDVSLAIEVRTARGIPVEDMAVTWTSSHGTITASGVTDADGVSSASWQLGSAPGTQTATANVPGMGQLPFTATASEWYVRADYTGARSGRLRALEPAEIEDGRFTNDRGFGLGLRQEPSGDDPGWWGVVAFHARSFPTGHLILFDSEGAPEPGEYALPGDAFGLADFEMRLTDGQFNNTNSTVFHDFASGSITLTAVTDQVLEGTFEGQAHAIDGESGVVTVTEGRFRIPIFDVEEAPAAAAAIRSGDGGGADARAGRGGPSGD